MKRWVAFNIWFLLGLGALAPMLAISQQHVARLTSDELKLWQGVSAAEVELLIEGRLHPVRDVQLIGPLTSSREAPMVR